MSPAPVDSKWTNPLDNMSAGPSKSQRPTSPTKRSPYKSESTKLPPPRTHQLPPPPPGAKGVPRFRTPEPEPSRPAHEIRHGERSAHSPRRDRVAPLSERVDDRSSTQSRNVAGEGSAGKSLLERIGRPGLSIKGADKRPDDRQDERSISIKGAGSRQDKPRDDRPEERRDAGARGADHERRDPPPITRQPERRDERPNERPREDRREADRRRDDRERSPRRDDRYNGTSYRDAARGYGDRYRDDRRAERRDDRRDDRRPDSWRPGGYDDRYGSGSDWRQDDRWRDDRRGDDRGRPRYDDRGYRDDRREPKRSPHRPVRPPTPPMLEDGEIEEEGEIAPAPPAASPPPPPPPDNAPPPPPDNAPPPPPANAPPPTSPAPDAKTSPKRPKGGYVPRIRGEGGGGDSGAHAPNRNLIDPVTRVSTPVGGREHHSSGPKLFRFPTAAEELEKLGRQFAGTTTLAAYDVGTKLGEGTFGVVTKAVELATKRQVALKKLITHNPRDGVSVTTVREIKILKELRHNNVVPILDMVVERKVPSDRSHRGEVFMVFPYMDHDLCGLLLNRDFKMSHSVAKLLFKQILEGLAYMHGQNIIHRDLKTANILVNKEGVVMIADFGLARTLGTEAMPAHSEHEYTNMVVTRWYRAPELLLGETKYGPAIDLWSMGCIIGEMYHREPIFSGDSDRDQLHKIFSRVGPPNQLSWPDWKKLKGFPEMTDHPWDQTHRETTMLQLASKWQMDRCGADLMVQLLRLDPKKRPTAAAALDHPWFWTSPLPAKLGQMPACESSHEMTTRDRAPPQAPPPQYHRQPSRPPGMAPGVAPAWSGQPRQPFPGRPQGGPGGPHGGMPGGMLGGMPGGMHGGMQGGPGGMRGNGPQRPYSQAHQRPPMGNGPGYPPPGPGGLNMGRPSANPPFPLAGNRGGGGRGPGGGGGPPPMGPGGGFKLAGGSHTSQLPSFGSSGRGLPPRPGGPPGVKRPPPPGDWDGQKRPRNDSRNDSLPY